VAVELFADQPSTYVTSGGTDAPVSGTVETWVVASSSEFPPVSSSATPPTQIHVCDPAVGYQTEIVLVSNMAGATWTVTRGAEGTTPVAHLAEFTVVQVVTAGALEQLQDTDWLNIVTMFGADPTGVSDSSAAMLEALVNGLGRTIYAPYGTYTFSELLTPPVPSGGAANGTTIQGAGWGTVFQFNQAVLPTLIGTNGTTQFKCDIRNLRIENSGTADGGTAINMNYFIYSVIDNVSVDVGVNGFHCGTGVLCTGGSTFYNEIRSPRISVNGSGAQGIAVTSGAYSNKVDHPRVVVGASGGTGSSGIYVDAHSTTIVHPDVEAAPGNGVFLDTLAHATTIINPFLEGNNVGLQISSGVYCPVIVGGTIEGNTTNLVDNGAVSPAYLQVWENSGISQISTLNTLLQQSENPLALAPSGATAETFPRMLATGTSGTIGQGAVFVVAIPMIAGVAVNHITLFSSSTSATQADLTHGWYALLDSTLTVKAVSSDQIDVAWMTSDNTGYTLSVAGSDYTTTYSGLYYIAFSASTSGGVQPSLQCRSSTGTGGAADVAPILQGSAGTQAAPPTLGAQLNSGTVVYGNSGNFYAYTS
jgi:hypothetical protein